MVSGYVRMRRPVEEAMARYGRWIEVPELGPPRLVRERDKIDFALVDENWLGLAVYIYASGSWTVIEELSGGLGSRPAAAWLALADGGDLVYAGYNDTIAYAELVVVEDGRLVRHFMEDEQDPSAKVDIGRLPEEARNPFEDWTDVLTWVEQDEDKLAHSEEGWLWIHEATWPETP
jgi:hypothetical protein